ncbi:MAG: HYC_CC_PP family protein [Candidatus Cyclobacteriaceae bacterium M3_2C_046]
MKNLLHVWMAILLVVSTAGISVSKHMCGERLHDLAIMHEAENCFGGHGMDLPGCCTNEVENHRVTDDFQFESTRLISFHLGPVLALLKTDFQQLIIENTSPQFFAQFKSPPLADPERYIRTQSFLL